MRAYGSLGLAIIAGAAACTNLEKIAVDLGFGPPKVEPREIHAAEGATVRHDDLTAILSPAVDGEGWVTYDELDRERLQAYIERLAGIDLMALGRDARLATLINAYNAFTLQLILDHRPLESIKDIPDDERWNAERWNLGGDVVSLNQIEHQRIRENFVEPRIHFAVNCASVGCPPLASQAYEADTLDEDLDAAAGRVHDPAGRWFAWEGDSDRLRLHITRLYLWYRSDFEAASGTVESFLSRYVPALVQAERSKRRVRIDYLDYDWSLNDIANRPSGSDP